jgi:hypothetical protein
MAMLRAALPYTAGQGRYALDLLLQADTLLNKLRGGVSSDLEACEAEGEPEEMLLHVQEFCTPKESDFIQMILNFRKADHLFKNYRDFVSSHHQTDSSSDLHAAGTGNGSQMMDFLMSQLSPEQQQLFQQLKNFSEDEERKETPYDTFETE